MENLQKVGLIFWKNLFGFKLRWTINLMNLLVTLLVFIIAKRYNALSKVDKKNGTVFTPFPVDEVPITQIIAWSPCGNEKLKKTMTEIAAELKTTEVCYDNSVLLESNTEVDDNVLCAVQFNDELAKDSLIPKVANVILRFHDDQDWNTGEVFPIESSSGPRNEDLNNGALPEYDKQGFLRVQKAVSIGIMKHFAETELGKEHWEKIKMPKFSMQRFPYPPWKRFDKMMYLMLFCAIAICLMVPLLEVIIQLATEKGNQIQEALKIMGLPNWVNWAAWSLFILFLITVTNIILLILSFIQIGNFDGSPIFIYSGFLPLLLLFTINGLVLTVTTFFLLTVITNVFLSQQICTFLIMIPSMLIGYKPYLSDKSLLMLILYSFIPNGGLSIALLIVFEFEYLGKGLNFDNLTKVSKDVNFSCVHAIIIMLVYCCLFMVLTFYLEAVLPKAYGVRKPWYFPFTRDFWCPRKTVVGPNVAQTQNKLFEEEPRDMKPGIQIENAKKSFGKFEAVKGITLNMYEDQITCLLGHNAAGKSTTFSMITGMITPTSGRILVNGYDIVKNTGEARKGVGFCPQNNILFDHLTVKQHFYLFAKLKGVKADLNEEMQKYITLLNLEKKVNTAAANLSGGMKRKLSIGIAMIGNSKIVLLDEPTAGIDPLARRNVWNTLQREKLGRTILLTTHYMDEADLLGDRIAIMVDGEIETCGSTLYLKKKFDSGYHMVVEKTDQCNVNNVTKFLKDRLSSVTHESSVGSELKYTLKKEDASHFDGLFKDLEANRDKLNILTFGVAMATIEDVFLKTGIRKENKNTNKKPVLITEVTYEIGKKYYMNQIWTLLYKKMLILKRTWCTYLLQFLFLILPVIYGGLNKEKEKFMSPSPLMDIDFSKYDEPITLISGSGKYKEAFVKSTPTAIEDIGEDGNMKEHVLKIAGADIQKFRQRYIVGLSFSAEEITAWFNNEPYHSPPLALQSALNAILKKEIGPSYEIKIINHPLFKPKTDNTPSSFLNSYTLFLYMALPMFAIFYTSERAVGAKHLQIVAGVHPLLFWAIAIFVDFLILLIMLLPCIILIGIFNLVNTTTTTQIIKLYILFAIFGLCVIFLCVIFSKLRNIPVEAAMYCFLFIQIGGLIITIIQLFKKEKKEMSDEEQRAKWLSFINWFPSVSLNEGCQVIMGETVMNNFCQSIRKRCEVITEELAKAKCEEGICNAMPKCCTSHGIFSQYAPGIGTQLLKLTVFSLIALALIIFIELFGIGGINFVSGKKTKNSDKEDEDVVNEREKINAISKDFSAYNLVLQKLAKKYGICNTNYAVKGVSFGIPSYECFGLLGANGAGKTTIFNMITGKEAATSGKIYTKGLDMSKKKFTVFKMIGYCPQFDAILGELTCEETLIIFAMLHGISRKDSKLVAQQIGIDFQFEQHLNKMVKKCSGGTKRKLSTAVSMLGDPELIYLDEPSAGMDPVTRKFIWESINNARDNGKTVVLTSHSMEEVEALCTRVAIMVEGQLKCIGPIQRLKSKFVPGYTMIIKTKKATPERTEANFKGVHSFITSNFSKARLTEHYREMSTYVLESGGNLSKIFSIMEGAKQSLNIEDYVVSQGSLEQVFIKICTEEDV